MLEIAEGLVQLGLDIGIELDPRCETPEDVRRDRQIALLRPLVGLLANPRVDPEDLRNDDDRTPGGAGGAGNIGGNGAVVLDRGNLDGFGHGGSPRMVCIHP